MHTSLNLRVLLKNYRVRFLILPLREGRESKIECFHAIPPEFKLEELIGINKTSPRVQEECHDLMGVIKPAIPSETDKENFKRGEKKERSHNRRGLNANNKNLLDQKLLINTSDYCDISNIVRQGAEGLASTQFNIKALQGLLLTVGIAVVIMKFRNDRSGF